MTTENTTPSTQPAQAPKKAVAKKVPAKKGSKPQANAKKANTKQAQAKKVPAKKASTKPTSTKKSVRVRALEALQAHGKPMNASQIKEAIGLGHGLKPTMDQEVERGHLKALDLEPDAEKGITSATYYELTAAGRKAIANGTVDPKRGAAE